MKEKLISIFNGKTLFQVLVGIPFAIITFYFWPVLVHTLDPGSATFGLEVLEPIVVASIYVMTGAVFSYFGAKLFDGHFPQTIGPCDTSFLLFSLFYCGYLYGAASVLALSIAP
jgi:hypothetical protein